MLLDFLMRLMLAAKRAELTQFQPLRLSLLVLGLAVVLPLAFRALKCDYLAHFAPLRVARLWVVGGGKSFSYTLYILQPTTYSRISVTVPAPTVRPPSRIANRKPLSIATGVISSTSKFTLSPGITISVPSGNCATPVTSVVRK